MLTVLLFLLAGAVVNVAVAWGCAAWGELPPPLEPSYEMLDGTDAVWPRAHPSDYPPVPTLCRDDRSVGLRESMFRVPTRPLDVIQNMARRIEKQTAELAAAEADVEEGTAEHRMLLAGRALLEADIRDYRSWRPGVNGWYDSVITEAGWPLRSLEARVWRRGKLPEGPAPLTISEDLEGGVQIAVNPRRIPYSNRLEKRLVPFWPIWPGFAINTLFYAALLWLVFCGPLAVRRHIRRRRGRCLKCGYDLRGELDAGCPECGWGREETGVSIPEQ